MYVNTEQEVRFFSDSFGSKDLLSCKGLYLTCRFHLSLERVRANYSFFDSVKMTPFYSQPLKDLLKHQGDRNHQVHFKHCDTHLQIGKEDITFQWNLALP